jgi:hypothetical protein
MTVVVDPAADVRIEHPRQVIECLVAAPLKTPATHRLANCFQRLRARCRKKRGSVRSAWPLRLPWPKTVAQEVELLVSIVPFPIGVLAIDDLSLVCMEFQSTLQKPAFQNLAQFRRFMLAPAVAYDVGKIPHTLEARPSCGSSRFRLATTKATTPRPLRSNSITEPSSLLRAVLPLCPVIGTLDLAGFTAWPSPFATGRQVLPFHTKA